MFLLHFPSRSRRCIFYEFRVLPDRQTDSTASVRRSIEISMIKIDSIGSYVPPSGYIPLGQSSDPEAAENHDDPQTKKKNNNDGGDLLLLLPQQWSSGICACCDDMQSCVIGLICPCYLFGKNAEFLGSGTLMGSCMTHFILCGLVNSLCCLLSGGLLLGMPGCYVASYACGYRRVLRSQYSLPEAPCGDLITHLFCHLCALCQEYREIRERSPSQQGHELTAPPPQKMEANLPTQE